MKQENNRPRLIEMPRFCDPRGNLSFAQDDDQVPFTIRHVSWVYDLPADSTVPPVYANGQQVIVPLAGSFDIRVETSAGYTSLHHLNRAYIGLYVPSGTHVSILNTSTNSVALILSSTLDPADDD